jgi:hypothetical protein
MSKQIPVLGAIFNRGDIGGFYDYNVCKESIDSFFKGNRPREYVFGGKTPLLLITMCKTTSSHPLSLMLYLLLFIYKVIPEATVLDGAREKVGDMNPEDVLQVANACVDHVCSHVNIEQLVMAAACDPWNQRTFSLTSLLSSTSFTAPTYQPHNSFAAPIRVQSKDQPTMKRSREEVEAAAAKKGARGG